jgi:hypothetical protein
MKRKPSCRNYKQTFFTYPVSAHSGRWPREYELYLAIEDIDHSRTKTKSNSIYERFHKTVLNEFYRVAFRKKVYRSIGFVTFVGFTCQ